MVIGIITIWYTKSKSISALQAACAFHSGHDQPAHVDSTGGHPLHDCAPDLVRAIFAFDDSSIDHGERVVEAIICPWFGERRDTKNAAIQVDVKDLAVVANKSLEVSVQACGYPHHRVH